MLEVNDRRERELGENIREHVGCGTPRDGDSTLLDEVTVEVVLYVNVFCPQICYVIGGKGDTNLVVFKDEGRACERTSHSGKELTKKQNFF